VEAGAASRLGAAGRAAPAAAPVRAARRDSQSRAWTKRRYLEDVAIHSVDLLLERLTPDARRLLWVVTRASEPVAEALLEAVWWAAPPTLPPLLQELVSAGLLTPEDGAFGFHELVKERATAWMETHPEEGGGRTEAEVWRAYGECCRAAFEALTSAGQPGARERAAEAGRRGLAYLVRSGAFGELAVFASALVTGMRDPSLLRAVIAELEAVADRVPAGEDRWSLRANLADAFRMAERPDAALALCEEAAAEAEAAGHWEDVGWICQNWANALHGVGRFDDARPTNGARRPTAGPERPG
jgi:hypothetical protein